MKLLGWLVASVLAVTSIPAAAQQATKIGFVSTERILRDAVPAKAAQDKLEQEFSKREKELQDMGARLRSLGERIDRDAAVMSDADRLRRQREFTDLDKDFQRRQREFREDLNQRRNEELAHVIDKVNQAIKQIAEQENYDLIVQEAVVASPRVDITDKVLRALADGKP